MITPPKTIREIIEAHKSVTVQELMAIPGVDRLCAIIGGLVSTQDPADVAVALALILGSICFDAEMQAALAPIDCHLKAKGQPHTCSELWPFHEQSWCPACGRNTTQATFEERLELFGVHAKIGYDGVKAFAKETQPYNDGKQTH